MRLLLSDAGHDVLIDARADLVVRVRWPPADGVGGLGDDEAVVGDRQSALDDQVRQLGRDHPAHTSSRLTSMRPVNESWATRKRFGA